MDTRIGDKFLKCSVGWGGSCFEKDIESLIYILEANDMHDSAVYWQGIIDINNY